MTKKIFRSTIAVVITVLFLSLFVIAGILNDHFEENLKNNLKNELFVAAKGVEYGKEEYLKEVSETDYRFTWISPEGIVLFDSKAKASSMENHSDRKEFITALTEGYSETSRYSDTLMQTTFYAAQRLEDGSILRMSTGSDSVYAILINVLIPLGIIGLVGMILSALLANKMAKSIVKPLEMLDSENPSSEGIYEELIPIIGKITRQHRQISEQIDELRKKADEFDQITYSMSEGLILIDKDRTVRIMNPSARSIFGLDRSPVGYDFFVVDRSHYMHSAVEDALNGKHSQFREEHFGREYRFSVSGIASDGQIVACLILCFDISESAFAERNRREFTANVSHELKTPLQSIIGSAELLESGLVKPEDTEKFIGNIKNEASRLVDLINDIIRLSQLDENIPLPPEDVDLFELSKEAISVLSDSAKKNGVEIFLSGESCIISGVRRYLYEIIYNLLDNAIRYNNEGGKAYIDVKKINSKAMLSVKDTGIGIPPQHVQRVFERFYRVDKSHSRETGGTGLGLSIVKHAAAYHNASINVQSKPGAGTEITITF